MGQEDTAKNLLAEGPRLELVVGAVEPSSQPGALDAGRLEPSLDYPAVEVDLEPPCVARRASDDDDRLVFFQPFRQTVDLVERLFDPVVRRVRRAAPC